MSKFLRNIILVILMFQLHLGISQSSLSSKNKKAIKYYKQAESLIRQRNYSKAEIILKKALKKDENFKECILLLGDVYRDQYKNDEAINIYEKLLKQDSSFYPAVYYFLGDLYLEEEAFDKSIKSYKTYLKLEGNNPERAMLAEFGYEKAVFVKYAINNPVDVNIIRLDTNFNSNNEEYINFVNDDENYMVFTRKDYGDLGLASSYFREYFMESNKIDGKWQTPKEIKIPNGQGNTGGMSLSFDGKDMYFTGCNWPEGMGSCDIYLSKKQSGKWSEAIPVSSSINSASWDSQASISADGNTIYFASRRKGGKGGSDIWKSELLENGKWSPAINLGDSINTAGNEMSPYIHPDGRTLYYSSDGTIGMGGYDLLISRKDFTNRWEKGKNLGYPINTKYDEISIFPSLNGNIAWISSNRNADSTHYDIYSLRMSENIAPEKVLVFKGKVIDKKSKKPLQSTVEITDLKTVKLFSKSESDKGDGSFMSVLFPKRTYALNISKDGYFFYSSTLNEFENYDKENIFELVKIEKGHSVDLNNIYFDTDKWTIKDESLPELNKLIKLLNKNPEIIILIEGHTDNVGLDDYNLELSEKRAKSVEDFLIINGISKSRLSHIGRGSKYPVSDNSSEKGRSLNRRTTIVVK